MLSKSCGADCAPLEAYFARQFRIVSQESHFRARGMCSLESLQRAKPDGPSLYSRVLLDPHRLVGTWRNPQLVTSSAKAA